MSNIIIEGIESLFGSYFAARYLQSGGDQIFYCGKSGSGAAEQKIVDVVVHAACRTTKQAATPEAQVISRLHPIENAIEGTAADVTAAWYFTGPSAARDSHEAVDRLLAACHRHGVKQFNFVASDIAGVKAASSSKLFADEIQQRCQAHQISCRKFHTSLIAGSAHPAIEESAVLSRLFAALHAFKAEIEERSSQYFDFRTLRCHVPARAIVKLLPATRAAELLLRISEEETTRDSDFLITNPSDTSFGEFCERLGVAYGLGLLASDDAGSLNAIDRAFHERLRGLEEYFTAEQLAAPTKADRVIHLQQEEVRFEEEEQIELFESIRRDQDEALAARRYRAMKLPARLSRKVINRDGSELVYFTAGDGDPVVILNALGQGLEYWYRVLDNMVGSHRVIVWEPRGTTAPQPPFGLSDQVDDLDAVLQNENIESVHLLGWCTGPKVAIDYYLRRPAVVRSMVLLNGTFKCDGSPEHLNSPYEHNVESLLRMVAKKPAMAAMVRTTFQNPVETDEPALREGSDGEEASVRVLSSMNSHLKSHVLAPFTTEQTTVNYAHQLIDFWSRDVRPQAREVKVPVLLIAAEYDQVATPAGAKAAADLFPNAHYLFLRGSTHYCLYDRPEFLGGVLKDFFSNPAAFLVSRWSPDTVWSGEARAAQPSALNADGAISAVATLSPN